RIEVLRDGKKAGTYRLVGAGPAGESIIAQRSPVARALIERAVYERILPRLAVTAPHYYGSREDGRDFVWLFLEDLADERFSKTDPVHAEHARRWVGTMHSGAAWISAARQLPDGGPLRYRDHLRAGRHTIRVHIANPALTPPDVDLLERLVTDLDALERRWAGIEDACTSTPPTLTHGDIQRKNIYVRSGPSGPALFLIDWETAGWGVPAARPGAPPRHSIPGTAEPGWTELCDVLEDVLADNGANGGPIELERLKSRVYRLGVGADGRAHSFVLKRFDPWLARRNELVLRRWLPALGLEERAPRLLATAAERHGGGVWHVYEGLGEGALDPAHPDPERVGVVVALIAELHTRAAGHALVPECRHFCGNLGAPFFAANLADAIALLERLAPPRVEPTPEQGALRGRLLTRLYRLRDDLPRRVHLLETLGGP